MSTAPGASPRATGARLAFSPRCPPPRRRPPSAPTRTDGSPEFDAPRGAPNAHERPRGGRSDGRGRAPSVPRSVHEASATLRAALPCLCARLCNRSVCIVIATRMPPEPSSSADGRPPSDVNGRRLPSVVWRALACRWPAAWVRRRSGATRHTCQNEPGLNDSNHMRVTRPHLRCMVGPPHRQTRGTRVRESEGTCARTRATRVTPPAAAAVATPVDGPSPRVHPGSAHAGALRTSLERANPEIRSGKRLTIREDGRPRLGVGRYAFVLGTMLGAGAYARGPETAADDGPSRRTTDDDGG